jgi:hypothetical protein
LLKDAECFELSSVSSPVLSSFATKIEVLLYKKNPAPTPAAITRQTAATTPAIRGAFDFFCAIGWTTGCSTTGCCCAGISVTRAPHLVQNSA